MLTDKDGNKLYRQVEIRVIFPEHIFPDRKIMQKAKGSRQGYGPEGVLDILMAVADQLETLYPYWEFESTELASVAHTAKYVFNFVGYRSLKSGDNETESNTTEASEGTASSEVGIMPEVPSPSAS